jgi:signal transduction histidine kinase
MYTVALTQPRTIAIAAIGALEVGVLIAALRWSQSSVLEGFVALSAMVIAAVVLGINIRQRRALLGSLHERAARLELERDQQGRLATAAERARIAREMHDVVAHTMAIMVIQAGAARSVLDRDAAAAEQALEVVEETGRMAMTELRRLLGFLREDAPAELAPQPSLDDLGALVGRARDAGLKVDLRAEGSSFELDPGAALAVYRVVQEALTNTLKHAGPGAQATVTLHWGGDELEVAVLDDGGSGRGAGGGSGQGLVGMRERLAMIGGALQARPRPDGGFAVRATIPRTKVAA